MIYEHEKKESIRRKLERHRRIEPSRVKLGGNPTESDGEYVLNLLRFKGEEDNQHISFISGESNR